MPQTLYASFADPANAERAAGALLDFGVRQEDVSLVSSSGNAGNERRDFATHTATLEERTTTGAGTMTVGDEAYESGHTGAVERRSWGNEVAESGDRFGARVSSALGAGNVASNYEAAADARAENETPYTDTMGRPALDRVDASANRDDYAGDNADHNELAAKTGISTTTPADAAAGAAKGAGIGLGLGVLAAIASIAIPGFGLVAGGGALATAIAGAAGTTVAGAVAGGVHGYLKDQGVPEDAAERFDQVYRGGGAILAVTVPSNNVDQVTVEEILRKYHAGDVGTYGSVAA